MIKCDKRAFSKCKYKEYCGLDAEFSEGSECEKFNRLIIHQPMTNADRIRSMSDDELAMWLAKQAENNPSDDPLVWTDWLKQPAEED